MMKKVFSLMLLCTVLFLTGCGGNKEAKKDGELVMGFIYVGPIGDGGWTYAQNVGREYVEEQTGIKTIYRESVPEGPEVIEVAKNMIDQGANIIMAGSFGYMDYIEELSHEFPKVKFLHASGYKTTENMTNFFGRIYEARYLSGIVAGMQTKSNKIGYVAAFPIPEVIRGINAFTLGVKSVNPKATVEVVWTNTWYDPAKEKDAAIALLDKGSDVIAQHQDTAGPQQAAEERGVWSVGYNTDMTAVAENAHLTAPIWNWGPYLVSQVNAVKDGTWTNTPYWGGLKDGVVKLAPLTKNVNSNASEVVDEYTKKIIDGSFHVFQGEIKDQKGNVVVEKGETLTDGELLGMDWFVEGVIGKI
jgi:basic membrane protein A